MAVLATPRLVFNGLPNFWTANDLAQFIFLLGCIVTSITMQEGDASRPDSQTGFVSVATEEVANTLTGYSHKMQPYLGAPRSIRIERQHAPGVCSKCKAPGHTARQCIRCKTCNGTGEVRRVQQSILGQFVNVSTCPTCNGAGEVITSPCKECNGYKQVRKTLHRVVAIPPGVDTGTQIRLNSEGEPGMNGGPAGNLYVVINVAPHKFFRRKDEDVIIELPINVAQAALGDEIRVPTVDGDEALQIPPGTQSGQVFRIKGKGVPHLRRNTRGDELVLVTVDVPRSLSIEQRRIFTELSKTLGKEVVPQQEKGFFDKLKDAFGV